MLGPFLTWQKLAKKTMLADILALNLILNFFSDGIYVYPTLHHPTTFPLAERTNMPPFPRYLEVSSSPSSVIRPQLYTGSQKMKLRLLPHGIY